MFQDEHQDDKHYDPGEHLFHAELLEPKEGLVSYLATENSLYIYGVLHGTIQFGLK